MAAHFFTFIVLRVLNISLLVITALLLSMAVQAHNHDAATNLENVEAFQSIEPSAKSGNPAAQRLLASMYEHGEGVKQNLAQAIHWYTQAAEREDDIAQFYLGYLNYQGVGLPINLETAFKWFEKAAKQGNPDFQYNIGNLHRYGEGTAKDIQPALRWYLLAAEQGQVNAQQDLAALYLNGSEVTKDLVKAYVWQAIANTNLYDVDILEKSPLEEIAEQMSSDQLSQAKKQVTQWINDHPELY